jgi:hypothetical protein
MRAVDGIEPLGLRVATVGRVVAPPAAQVDPPDERDVVRPIVGPEHDELLVVRTGAAHPRVQQHLAARVVDDPRQIAMLPLVEAERLRVRPPQEAPDLHPSLGGLPQQLSETRPLRPKKLVGVAPPVGKEELVPRMQPLDERRETGEVVGAVDQGFDVVPECPRGGRGSRVAGRRSLPTFRLSQEPSGRPRCGSAIHRGSAHGPVSRHPGTLPISLGLEATA